MSARSHAYYVHVQDTAPVYARRLRTTLFYLSLPVLWLCKALVLACVFLVAVALGFLAAGRG